VSVRSNKSGESKGKDVEAQINATDVHVVTATVLVGGAPVANITAKLSCGLFASFAWNFELTNLAAGDVIAIKLLSDGVTATPLLKGGATKVEIYG